MDALAALAALLVGAGLGYLACREIERRTASSLRADAARALDAARKEAEHLVKEAQLRVKEDEVARRDALAREEKELRADLGARERRLEKREDDLGARGAEAARREEAAESAERDLAARRAALVADERRAEEQKERELAELARVAGLPRDEARALLLERLKAEVEHDEGELVLKSVKRAQEEVDRRARELLATAVQRVATSHAQEALVTSVTVPTEEMKGRIIGREGRNIRAFEKATGTDVIVDDTPGVIVLSSFDGVRREVARRAMEKLIADGRIHPTRIEEIAKESLDEMQQLVVETGREAVIAVGVPGIHERLVEVLGRLKFRTSYGQNVLHHSIEVAQLCGTLAGELGLDVKLAKRCGLLHDLGKALDHELEGGHPEIGAELGRRYAEPPEVVNAIASHHDGCPQESLYAYVVMAADAVSGGRPGARGESLERYIHRLAKLEEVATAFPGVRQAYAIQAGREVRVVVNANKVSDKQAAKLARDIARQIESELTYPGEIKVTLLRETRVIELAR